MCQVRPLELRNQVNQASSVSRQYQNRLISCKRDLWNKVNEADDDDKEVEQIPAILQVRSFAKKKACVCVCVCMCVCVYVCVCVCVCVCV